MRLVSWNVAGIRACIKKGLPDFLAKIDADVFCMQEVKAEMNQIPPALLRKGTSHSDGVFFFATEGI